MGSRATALVFVAVIATFGGVSTAGAAVPPSASNMGYCSPYLAQLDNPLSDGNVRAEVNGVIKEYGEFLGLDSPGDLYKVRARQHVNAPQVEECTPRQLPGGGQG